MLVDTLGIWKAVLMAVAKAVLMVAWKVQSKADMTETPLVEPKVHM